jgi:hypothetical protein
MKKVLLLAPRLDVMFKKGPVPDTRGNIPPIREHWKKFIQKVEQEYMSRSDVSFRRLELPLWQITPELINQLAPDMVFIPHKEKHNFQVDIPEAYYYMQTMMPWLFTVDPIGWAGGSSVYPFDKQTDEAPVNSQVFNTLSLRTFHNQSKFEQPAKRDIKLPENFIFYPCQIPHDETIKYHSNVTAEQALEMTCESAKELGLEVVIKGHPVNPGSMATLREIASRYSHAHWIDNISIHQVIPKAKVVVVVNSGVGMETLLHEIPVITLGKSEYDTVANKVTTNLTDTIKSAKFDKQRTCQFFNAWVGHCYDSTDISTFKKLPV